ncbi:MAG TPA: ATP-binding protein [Firmicutes bacterium]|nr:ATP-binding protein [Bacillota bacterium]
MHCRKLKRNLQEACPCSLSCIDESMYKSLYGKEEPLRVYLIEKKSDVTFIRHAVDKLLKAAAAAWVDPARRGILLALTEAVTNVVKHTPGGKVLVFLTADGPRFHVIDRGKGFPQGKLPCLWFKKGYSTSDSLGAGFLMMMKYMREIVVCSGVKGTILIMQADLKTR